MASINTAAQRDLEKLTTYLNNQPDALTAIVKNHTDFKGKCGDLHILTFDPDGKSVKLVLYPPGQKDSTVLDVPFEPPLGHIRDARPRLLRMRDEAWKKYGVPQRPVIPYYVFPPLFPYLAPVLLGMGALFFALLGVGHYADLWRGWIIKTFGKGMIPAATWFMVIMHIGEAGYIGWAASKHQVPFGASVKWVLTTLAVGIASIIEFWESVQHERIRVIYRKTDVGETPSRVPETDVTATKKQQ